jgi:hypothetical protein
MKCEERLAGGNKRIKSKKEGERKTERKTTNRKIYYIEKNLHRKLASRVISNLKT